MQQKNMYIIAGCNGAGKTTASFTILPDIIDCNEFVNADEIAKGLSPFKPEKVAIQSGRLMLQRINNLICQDESFAVETTLSTKNYKEKIIKAKKNGFNTILIFFWLNKVELAIERVKIRVEEGGHDIPKEVIVRRYHNGIKNLFSIYWDLVDELLIYDNSFGEHELIAQKRDDNNLKIYNQVKFKNLKELSA
jgi:predicted ABC-type ATPase